jgi:phosphoglycerol transferase MdoB-like AlkP superfamily enzyme
MSIATRLRSGGSDTSLELHRRGAAAWLWLPRTVRLAVAIVPAELLAFTALRVVFWRVFADPLAPAPAGELARAFYVGFKFDLRLALITVAPLLLLGWCRSLCPCVRAGRRFWQAFFTALALFLVLAYLADFAHYAYLETRLSATALQYLGSPIISLRMIWETYPVGWAVAGVMLLALATWLGVGNVARRPAIEAPAVLRGWRRIAVGAAVTVLVLLGVYGTLTWYPLRWSDAFFSTDNFVSAVGLNPVLEFFDTYGERGQAFDLNKVRQSYQTMASYLGIDHPDPEHLTFARREQRAGPLAGRRPNVVIILLESFAAYKTGAFGNPLDPSPQFDALAAGGTLFTRFYSPSHGTARSVFTTVTGIPDVAAGDTSSRNPLAVNQRTIINALPGYQKYYFLGGSASWGNIRGLLLHNLPGLHLFEEGDYDAPRVDVWGVSDLDLFRTADRVLRRAGDTPFFAIIQTSGNHRPYTIPTDNDGFVRRDPGDEAARSNGFASVDAYNSFRFLDHCLGAYFRLAHTSPYFRNTVFLLYGDHGLPRRPAAWSKAEVELAITRFHVPFLVYAPDLLPGGRRIDIVASEVDVLPTIAGLFGVPYLDTTIGRDLLDPRFDGSRYAFTITDQFGCPEINLLSDRFYLRMPRDGDTATLHDLGSNTPMEDVSAQHPGETAAMAHLCRSIYETARYMLYHNAARGTEAGDAQSAATAAP